MLRQINLIADEADEYIDLGRNLTVRQLHYQFVARGCGPNTQANYELLQRTIRNARLGGMLTWDVIVDRTRHVREDAMVDDRHGCLRALG